MGASAAAGFAGLGGIFMGMEAAKEETEARSLEAQRVLYDGKEAADFHLEQTAGLVADQRGAYIKSGVTLEGSPLLTMERTLEQGVEDAKKIVKRAGEDAAVVVRGGRARVIAQQAFTNAANTFASAGAGASSRGAI